MAHTLVSKRTSHTLILGFAVLLAAGCDGSTLDPAPDDRPGEVVFGELTDPTDYVLTPGGMIHRSCVHAVPNGARVDADGMITLATGDLVQTPPCRYRAHPDLAGADPGRGTEPSGIDPSLPSPAISGWVEYSSWFIGGGNWLSLQTADFVVPNHPPSWAGQLLYYFPGMQNGTRILQPVLQYGNSPAGGGAFWGIASWSCNDGSACFHGPLVGVAPGQVISGSVYGHDCGPGGDCVWHITTSAPGGSSVYDWGDPAPYTQAIGGALEVYNVGACNQFPAGPTVMNNIAVYDQYGSQQYTPWENIRIGGNPDCGFDVSASGGTTALFHLPFAPSDGGPFAGCFEDAAGRALPVYAGSSGGMTPALCRSMCSSYAYAGVQYYDQCFCGNSLGYGQRPVGECNTPCSGNGNVACGGPWRNSIYSAGGGGGGGGVTFYDDVGFGGASFSAGTSSEFVGWDWNDRVSSLRVPSGRTVVLHSDWYYGGDSLTLGAGDHPDLRWYGWNDSLSSFEIY